MARAKLGPNIGKIDAGDLPPCDTLVAPLNVGDKYDLNGDYTVLDQYVLAGVHLLPFKNVHAYINGSLDGVRFYH